VSGHGRRLTRQRKLAEAQDGEVSHQKFDKLLRELQYQARAQKRVQRRDRDQAVTDDSEKRPVQDVRSSGRT
jgi:hypothetical protein